MAKKTVAPVKIKINIKSKKDEKDGFVCVSCGYSGHGTFDDETRTYVCPECGANLEEGDLLKYKTPESYGDDDLLGLGDKDLPANLLPEE